MLKRVIALVCLVCMSFHLFTGCTGDKNTGTKEIVDGVGRSVVVPNDVKRIASFNTDLTEIIIALGGIDKLVIQDYNTYADVSWLGQNFPKLKELPAPYSPAGFNVEELLNTKPDIIITTSVGTLPLNELESVHEKYGIPVVCFSFQSLDTYFDELALLADVIGAGDRKETISQTLSATINDVAIRVSNIKYDDKVKVYHSLSTEFFTFGKGIFEEGQIIYAGGICVTSELAGFNITVNAEEIYKWNPDVIVVLYEADPDGFYINKQLENLSAVQNRKVFRHPEPGWGFLTPRAVFAVKWLSYYFYPELYQDINIDDEADIFYKALYGFGKTYN